MPFTLSSVIIDAADIEPEGAFWHQMLGGSIHRTPTHHFIQVPGLPVIVVQAAPDQIAPHWPEGTSQQMHLDFASTTSRWPRHRHCCRRRSAAAHLRRHREHRQPRLR